MMTFRKLAAASAGKLIRAYFTENTPEPIHDPVTTPGKHLDPGGRLTAYYTGRDSRATWRPDMPQAVAKVLGIDPTRMPKDAQLDRLFEAKRADNGEAWSSQERKISAYDLTMAPHKSVTLAAEFAATPAESAAIWHAIDKANDATMRYVARELGWARKGKGGEDGADPGAVAWVSFRHHTARPTLPVQDGPGGATYLATVPTDGDPHAHIHNALFNVVVTDDGRVGSLDTQQLHSRVHEFGAYFQARLAEELRRLGARTAYDKEQQAVVLEAIPQKANDLFSKGRKQVLHSARAYAKRQGLEWDQISAEGKLKILAVTGLASRQDKHGNKNDREIWREQAEDIGWHHKTVMHEVEHPKLTDAERFDRAYAFAARHLAKEFQTAAVIDHDKLRMYAARGLIGTGIAGGPDDIDRVVALIEERGIQLRGEHVALVVGHSGEKVRVTNTAQTRIEQALAWHGRRAAGDRAGALPATAIKAAVDASGLDFTSKPEHARAQLAAIYAMGQGGALTVLTGVAGAGKTTLMKPLVAAWKDHGVGGRDRRGGQGPPGTRGHEADHQSRPLGAGGRGYGRQALQGARHRPAAGCARGAGDGGRRLYLPEPSLPDLGGRGPQHRPGGPAAAAGRSRADQPAPAYRRTRRGVATQPCDSWAARGRGPPAAPAGRGRGHPPQAGGGACGTTVPAQASAAAAQFVALGGHVRATQSGHSLSAPAYKIVIYQYFMLVFWSWSP
ncbi:MobF family relaxase [Roseomonas chloroacetimidivorans]|uniref:MobF family relaxase n=1 Tax=Roseomonas chloroacetimidivorans TaxID=1766656 RepID=UPI003C789649